MKNSQLYILIGNLFLMTSMLCNDAFTVFIALFLGILNGVFGIRFLNKE